MGLFGRRTDDRDGDGVSDRVEAREERLVDRDGDGVDDRDERRTAAPPAVATKVDRDRDGVDDRVDSRVDRDRDGVDDRDERRGAAPAAVAPAVDRDRDGVDDRVERPEPPARTEPRWKARASLIATLALIIGLTSVYASLTGRLAPAGIALGVLGLLFSIAGLSATGRPRVAGGGMAMFALLLSVAGAVFGILAVSHATPWLDSDVDQVARWREWLDTQLPFIEGW